MSGEKIPSWEYDPPYNVQVVDDFYTCEVRARSFNNAVERDTIEFPKDVRHAFAKCAIINPQEYFNPSH